MLYLLHKVIQHLDNQYLNGDRVQIMFKKSDMRSGIHADSFHHSVQEETPQIPGPEEMEDW